MLTAARVREDLQPVAGIEWITALKSVEVQKPVSEEALQLSPFDEQDLAEITHPDYPDKRLIACYNPLLADERKRMLAATEKKLDELVAATQRHPAALTGREGDRPESGKGAGPVQGGQAFLSVTESSGEETVRRYKSLAVVERAFRSLKSVDLKVRPIRHYSAGRCFQ